ncbi:MAG: tetratricopeptide repeat protein [Dehalococcoidia bacterium]
MTTPNGQVGGGQDVRAGQRSPLPLLALCLILSLSTGTVAAQTDTPIPRLEYGKGRELAKLADPAINESSGLAAGRTNPGVFWTHNDSGSRPQVFAFTMEGKALATVTVTGARARDWEDIASFSFNGRGVLLAADVGDNSANRGLYTLYAFHEPRLKAQQRSAAGEVKLAQTINFKYEDGPHNCESVAVDPTDRTIYLVSKAGGGQCTVYALRWPKRAQKAPHVARAIATLKIPTTTAMDISPDGLRAVVLTYGPAFEYARRPTETWAQGFARPGRRIAIPARAQGESICYGPDGKTLYLTSECKGKDSANPSPLLEIPVTKDLPAAVGTVVKAKPRTQPATQPAAKPEPLTDQQQIDRQCKQSLNMAENYLRAGKPDKARQYLQKILDRYPDTPWAAKARARLAEINP